MGSLYETSEIIRLSLRIIVMVGGGAITADFAESIRADGYDATAPSAVELAKRLVGE